MKEQFGTVAMLALLKMQSLEGLLELFQEIPSHVALSWYYESYLRFLNWLGRRQDGKVLLQKVIDTAPRESIELRAKNLLAQHEASI